MSKGARQDLIDTALQMERAGLNQGSSGNMSVRDDAGFLITPSGIEYESMHSDQIVAMEFDGTWEGQGVRPSSEWRFHRDILLARPTVGAIVHAHPIHATALATHNRPIPAFHYMVAVAGGSDIPCAAYATFGTQELSNAVIAALADRDACLMAHHGLLACGATLSAAFRLAVEVETLAAQYLAALQCGEPPLLDADEMERVLQKFRAGYGYASGPLDEA